MRVERDTKLKVMRKCSMVTGYHGRDRKQGEQKERRGKNGGKDREAHSELWSGEKHTHTSTRSLRECR